MLINVMLIKKTCICGLIFRGLTIEKHHFLLEYQDFKRFFIISRGTNNMFTDFSKCSALCSHLIFIISYIRGVAFVRAYLSERELTLSGLLCLIFCYPIQQPVKDCKMSLILLKGAYIEKLCQSFETKERRVCQCLSIRSFFHSSRLVMFNFHLYSVISPSLISFLQQRKYQKNTVRLPPVGHSIKN